MNKKIPLYYVVLCVALAVVMTFNVTYLTINEKHNRRLDQFMAEYDGFEELMSVRSDLEQHYIGFEGIDDKAVSEAVIRGYLSAIGDRYALYMNSAEFEAYTSEQSGNTVGIGINVIYDPDTGIVEVISVLPDSPAEDVGLLNGDYLIGVDGERIDEIGYYEAIDKIRGESGTTVQLMLKRGDHELTVTCVRREVKTLSVTYHVFASDATVGVIRISEFNATTPEQCKAAVADLQNKGCTKLVFDVRNNPGGELNSIINTLDYLLPEGDLAHIYYQNGEDAHYTSDAAYVKASVAVLINKQTASAAELFTAALKDYDDKGMYNAVIVGVNSYGKGTLQRFFPLRDGATFKISVGRYDPPYSENYDGKGIAPDVEVELSEEAQSINFHKLTDENDNQLIAAVEALNSK